MKPPRASTVSRQLKGEWESIDPCPWFPIVEQAESTVLIEGGWETLGWAAWLLAQRGDYQLVVGGQWVFDADGAGIWQGWIEVTR